MPVCLYLFHIKYTVSSVAAKINYITLQYSECTTALQYVETPTLQKMEKYF